MENRFTLLVDSNWLLQSHFSLVQNKFLINNSEQAKKAAQRDLSDFMARSINVIINRFRSIDNIVIVADGGSWRKNYKKPTTLQNVVYKGNRENNQDYDWDYIWGALDDIIFASSKLGLTTCRAVGIEGDDWIYQWSRRLNKASVNCIIWSSDCDLKQLVQVDDVTRAFTVWYNDKNGVVIPEKLQDNTIDDLEFFFKPQPDSMILEDLKRRCKKHSYINPDSIALEKFICGDAGDNIMSIVKYEKNGRNYGVGPKDCEKILNELNITSIQNYLDNRSNIADWILNNKKYKDINMSKEQIIERIDYNIRMVWLNEYSIPQVITDCMLKEKYKKFDISYIRSNYRCLIGDESEEDIKNLFESM